MAVKTYCHNRVFLRGDFEAIFVFNDAGFDPVIIDRNISFITKNQTDISRTVQFVVGLCEVLVITPRTSSDACCKDQLCIGINNERCLQETSVEVFEAVHSTFKLTFMKYPDHNCIMETCIGQGEPS